MRMAPDILTVSGQYFSFITPEQSRFGIDDIAHALSHLCRFTGHTNRFYSVAQHSVLVSQTLPPELAMAGLMHDAAEAFIGDVSRPLKSLIPDYKAIERRIEAAVFSRFGLPIHIPEEVKVADIILLATEKRDLMPAHDDLWPVTMDVDALEETIYPVQPSVAKFMFLRRFQELSQGGLQ